MLAVRLRKKLLANIKNKMSFENFFPKGDGRSDKTEKPYVEGDGFTMRTSGRYGHQPGPRLEFKPGESSDTAREREK